jgi:hypothetical protein
MGQIRPISISFRPLINSCGNAAPAIGHVEPLPDIRVNLRIGSTSDLPRRTQTPRSLAVEYSQTCRHLRSAPVAKIVDLRGYSPNI